MNDAALMAMAREAALASPNVTRKVGCAVALASGRVVAGCNDFPPGVSPDPARVAGEDRYDWLEHAERAVVFECARLGLAMDGATMANTLFPCTECARAMAAVGVRRLVCVEEPDLTDPRWGTKFARGLEILAEAGVEVSYVG